MLLDFIYTSSNSFDLSVVAKVALCLAIHIQQLPRQFTSSQLNLPLSLEALQNCYLNAAESLLETDEGFAGTLDGIACMRSWGNTLVERIHRGLDREQNCQTESGREGLARARRAQLESWLKHYSTRLRTAKCSLQSRWVREQRSLWLLSQLCKLAAILPTGVSRSCIRWRVVCSWDVELSSGTCRVHCASLARHSLQRELFSFEDTTNFTSSACQAAVNAFPSSLRPEPRDSLDSIACIFNSLVKLDRGESGFGPY